VYLLRPVWILFVVANDVDLNEMDVFGEEVVLLENAQDALLLRLNGPSYQCVCLFHVLLNDVQVHKLNSLGRVYRGKGRSELIA